ncbi:family 43 glycosylhydrolase, partial [Streptomyces aculeolatus]
MSTGTGYGRHVDRRALLLGAAGAGRNSANWPDPEPYGLADTRADLWPRDDNSFVLPLE